MYFTEQLVGIRVYLVGLLCMNIVFTLKKDASSIQENEVIACHMAKLTIISEFVGSIGNITFHNDNHNDTSYKRRLVYHL
jgi:hypothetical protein